MNSDYEATERRIPVWARIIIEVVAVMGVIAVGALVVTTPSQRSMLAMSAANSTAQQSSDLCGDASDGFLTGRLHGALDMQIGWNGVSMKCAGMLRPDGNGIRLLFAGQNETDADLVFVLGIDGDIEHLLGQEHAANVTIIDESEGRFFSSGGNERCWAMIDRFERLADTDHTAYEVEGDVYCTGALPSLSDNRSVTLQDVRFSGRLSLDEP
jgi:hypothetical protein